METKTNIVAATLIVVAIGVAFYVSSVLSGISGSIRSVADAVVSTVSQKLGGVSNLDSLTLGDDLVVDKTSTLTGTTTPTQLLSPFGGSISTAATGTARTLNANTTGPKLCSLAVAGLSARNTGTFSPSLVVSVGTSTSAVTTTNIFASTTIATSTPGTSFFDTYAPIGTGRFVYRNGDELMAILGDITNTEASTTHMTNLTLDFRMWCSEIAI